MVAATAGDLALRVLRALHDAGIVPGGLADDGGSHTPGGEQPGALGSGVDDDVSAGAVWAAVLVVAAERVAASTQSSKGWSDSHVSRVVEDLDRASRVIGAAKAPLLVAQEASGTWRRPGVRSFEAHRAAAGREDLGAAKREAATARTLTELEGGVEAVTSGEMTPSHVQHLGRVADKVDPQVRDQLLTGPGAAVVLDLAREHEPKVFGRKVEELAATAQDPATVQEAHEAIRAKRFLRLLPTSDGTRLEGLLDPVAAHRVQLAIEAASPRPGPMTPAPWASATPTPWKPSRPRSWPKGTWPPPGTCPPRS